MSRPTIKQELLDKANASFAELSSEYESTSGHYEWVLAIIRKAKKKGTYRDT